MSYLSKVYTVYFKFIQAASAGTCVMRIRLLLMDRARKIAGQFHDIRMFPRSLIAIIIYIYESCTRMSTLCTRIDTTFMRRSAGVCVCDRLFDWLYHLRGMFLGCWIVIAWHDCEIENRAGSGKEKSRII